MLCLHLVRGDPGHISRVLGSEKITRWERCSRAASQDEKSQVSEGSDPHRCGGAAVSTAAGLAAEQEGDDLSCQPPGWWVAQLEVTDWRPAGGLAGSQDPTEGKSVGTTPRSMQAESERKVPVT